MKITLIIERFEVSFDVAFLVGNKNLSNAKAYLLANHTEALAKWLLGEKICTNEYVFTPYNNDEFLDIYGCYVETESQKSVNIWQHHYVVLGGFNKQHNSLTHIPIYYATGNLEKWLKRISHTDLLLMLDKISRNIGGAFIINNLNQYRVFKQLNFVVGNDIIEEYNSDLNEYKVVTKSDDVDFVIVNIK